MSLYWFLIISVYAQFHLGLSLLLPWMTDFSKYWWSYLLSGDQILGPYMVKASLEFNSFGNQSVGEKVHCQPAESGLCPFTSLLRNGNTCSCTLPGRSPRYWEHDSKNSLYLYDLFILFCPCLSKKSCVWSHMGLSKSWGKGHIVWALLTPPFCYYTH